MQNTTASIPQTLLNWRKSSFSGGAGNTNGCVGLAPLTEGGWAVKDLKLGDDSPVLRADSSFLKAVKNGSYDLA